MTELDSQTIQTELAKYKSATKDSPIFLLNDDRVVIGMIVDEDNHLHYVLRNVDKSCEVVDAESVSLLIVEDLRIVKSKTVTVTIEQS